MTFAFPLQVFGYHLQHQSDKEGRGEAGTERKEGFTHLWSLAHKGDNSALSE